MEHRCSTLTHPLLRPPPDGWRVPEAGDQVLYRDRCAEDPVPAVVIEVEDDPDDPNVWTEDDETGERIRKPLPNPNVRVEVGEGYRVTTRHIRYADSPGWAWPGQDN